MNCKIFLVVRKNSKRLPGKALLKIGKKSLIEILIDRIKTVKNIDDVIVCTTNKNSDNVLCKFLNDKKIRVFRGNEKDILTRLNQAAKKFNIKNFVIVEGDDVFCEPDFIDKTCATLNNSNVDFVVWKNVPFGSSPVGIKATKLNELVNQKSTSNTETGWIKFIIDSQLFTVKTLTAKNKKLQRDDIRLSVDYEEDFKLAKKLLKLLPEKFRLEDIINVFETNPTLFKINESVKIKYLKNFEKRRMKTRVVQK